MLDSCWFHAEFSQGKQKIHKTFSVEFMSDSCWIHADFMLNSVKEIQIFIGVRFMLDSCWIHAKPIILSFGNESMFFFQILALALSVIKTSFPYIVMDSKQYPPESQRWTNIRWGIGWKIGLLLDISGSCFIWYRAGADFLDSWKSAPARYQMEQLPDLYIHEPILDERDWFLLDIKAMCFLCCWAFPADCTAAHVQHQRKQMSDMWSKWCFSWFRGSSKGGMSFHFLSLAINLHCHG